MAPYCVSRADSAERDVVARRRALAAMSRERVLFHPELFDAYGSVVTLTSPRDVADHGELRRVVRLLQDAVGPEFEDCLERTDAEVNFVARFDVPLTLSPRVYYDDAGTEWVRFDVTMPLVSDDDLNEHEVTTLTNDVNQRARGFSAEHRPEIGHVVALVTLTAKLDDIGRAFMDTTLTLTRGMYVSALACLRSFSECASAVPVGSMEPLMEAAVSADLQACEEWTTRDVQRETRHYLDSLTSCKADDLFLIEPRSDGVTLRFPIPGRRGPDAELVVAVSDSVAGSGVSITGALPATLSPLAGLTWARNLSRGDPTRLTVQHAGTWALGPWVAVEDEQGRSALSFNGFVSSACRSYAPLAEHIDAAVREYVSAWTRTLNWRGRGRPHHEPDRAGCRARRHVHRSGPGSPGSPPGQQRAA